MYEFRSEYYEASFLDAYQLVSRRAALETVHFPKDYDSLARARRRLVFDEFFEFLFLIRSSQRLNKELPNNHKMFETADTVRFLEKLPFPLTKSQNKVWQEIREDLLGESCMNRLVQGDVGSGKTIVAVLALLMTAANGYQGALMAPTEVLAVQHFETIQK